MKKLAELLCIFLSLLLVLQVIPLNASAMNQSGNQSVDGSMIDIRTNQGMRK